MTPSKEEAFQALPDILYVIDQCMAFHVWRQRVKPELEKFVGHPLDESTVQIIENSTLESTLIFLRKLNEFFSKRHPQNKNDDSLRAYYFGDFIENGWFLTKDEYAELHIRVGHISVEEVRKGKKEWPINDYVYRALSKSFLFLTFISQSSNLDNEMKNPVMSKVELLRTYLDGFNIGHS